MTLRKSRRRTSHILVLDEESRLLLLRHFTGIATARHYWRPPGGALLPEETFAKGAIRLLREQTGIVISALDEPVAHRRRAPGPVSQRSTVEEQYFVVLAQAQAHGKVRARAKLPYHWWSADDLIHTREPMRPHDLLAMLVVDGWWS